jgi:hypothetical protein
LNVSNHMIFRSDPTVLTNISHYELHVFLRTTPKLANSLSQERNVPHGPTKENETSVMTITNYLIAVWFSR